VGRVSGEWIINPTFEQLEYSDMDIVVAGTQESIVMVEGASVEISEDDLVAALEVAHKGVQELIAIQHELVQMIGGPPQKFDYPSKSVSPDFEAAVRERAASKVEEALALPNKEERNQALSALRESVTADLEDEETFSEHLDDLSSVMKKLEKETMRRQILERGERIDGRGLGDIRPISSDVGILPRTHGSALFTRGQTQALCVATLGTIRDEQRIDSIDVREETSKSFMLHYNFPSFSVGEVRPFRGPGRREIGHGGSLSLMDAGVPLRSPCAGVAMGLVMEGDSVAILTDILGIEDALGDMDFKVAGTSDGITAIQMDIKIDGLSLDTLREALGRAREGRLHILEVMQQTLGEPRSEMSQYAPRIMTIQINPEKIGEVIGPKGKTIRSIQEQTGAQINIEDTGVVTVSSVSGEAAENARAMIEAIVEEPEVGRIYEGVVKNTTTFGAFVEIIPGTEGLCHISELEEGRTENTEDVVQPGDVVQVKLLAVDERGRLKLSRRAAMSAD